MLNRRPALLAKSLPLLVVALLSFTNAQPALSVAQKVISEGGPYVVKSTGELQRFTARLAVTGGQRSQPLYLTFYNGFSARPGFSWVRVFLNPPGVSPGPTGNVLVDERTFLQKNAITVDVSGMLSDQGNTLFIEGEGEVGADFSWCLTTVKNDLTLIDTTQITPGKSFYIHGTGFSADKNNNTVMLGGKPAQILEATDRVIKAQAPQDLDVTNKSARLTVSVNGRESNPIQAGFTILPPTLIGMSPYGGPVGGVLNLRGTNFSPIAAQNVVTIGPYNAPVVQVMDTGTLLVRIPNWGSSSGTLPVRVVTNGVPSTNTLQFWCTPHYYGGDPNAVEYGFD